MLSTTDTNSCVEVEELCVPPDAEQGSGEVDPGAAQWEGAGAPVLRGQGSDSVGEESSQESQLDVSGAGPVSRQAEVSERAAGSPQ